MAVWIATGGGAGYFPVAPGTVGSLEGIVTVLLLQFLPVGRIGHSLALGAVIATVFAVGVWSAGRAAVFFGSQDPGRVVIDEVAGQMLTFVAQPLVGWTWLVAGFALFRALDILKPFPADGAENLPGGWGIMTDDLVAGIYSLMALGFLQWLFA
ncbi:MAG: phosphatidylglycerophosphatase A [Acidobacteria bacterium]|nr:MAG: phosphatidylglycerophosphatase A [Acidobacteriota bacterium]